MISFLKISLIEAKDGEGKLTAPASLCSLRRKDIPELHSVISGTARAEDPGLSASREVAEAVHAESVRLKQNEKDYSNCFDTLQRKKRFLFLPNIISCL